MKWFINYSILLMAGLLALVSNQSASAQAVQVEPGRSLPLNRPRVTGTTASSFQSQDEASGQTGNWSTRNFSRLGGVARDPSVSSSFFANQTRGKLQSKIDAKIRQYKSTTENKQRKSIEDEVRKLLSQQFDERLKEPKQRADNSRKRLDDLKKQIRNRANKADDIVDLRLKVITHEALGLGWGSGSHHQWRPVTETYYVPNTNGKHTTLVPMTRTTMVPSLTAKAPRIANSQPPRTPGFPNNPYRTEPNTNFRAQNAPARTMPALPGVAPQVPRPAVVNKNRTGRQLPDDKPSIHQLLRDYKEAKSDEDREPIEEEIRSLLESDFKRYQKQLSDSADRIEKQITNLEDNLAERKKMKDSIVDLKLKTIINQANGLGF